MPPIAEWTQKGAHIWLKCHHLDDAWSGFNSHTQDVVAAGGLLVNGAGELLCIHRHGHWDLPKGKVEPGEDLKSAAAREVHEECGVPLPIVGRPFATTYHVYGPDNGLMKVTHWYEMSPGTGTEAGSLKPQTEEGITEVRWAGPKELDTLIPAAYGNIGRLMTAWKASR